MFIGNIHLTFKISGKLFSDGEFESCLVESVLHMLHGNGVLLDCQNKRTYLIWRTSYFLILRIHRIIWEFNIQTYGLETFNKTSYT